MSLPTIYRHRAFNKNAFMAILRQLRQYNVRRNEGKAPDIHVRFEPHLDFLHRFSYKPPLSSRPASSVGIATGYGLDGPGIESRWGSEIFRTCPDRPWGPPSLLYNGYRVFPEGKERPGRDADSSPLLVPWS